MIAVTNEHQKRMGNKRDKYHSPYSHEVLGLQLRNPKLMFQIFKPFLNIPHSAVSGKAFLIMIYCVFYLFCRHTKSVEELENGTQLHHAGQRGRAKHVFCA